MILISWKNQKKYLLNNSTDQTLYTQYEYLCQKYDFEILGNGTNLGICGGRQFIAEHFEQSSSEYMFFFEDDMIFYTEDQKPAGMDLVDT